MKESDIPRQKCPYCGQEVNRTASLTEDKPPIPGHPSICAVCAGLSVFNDDLGLVRATQEDIERFKLYPRGWQAIETTIDTIKRFRSRST